MSADAYEACRFVQRYSQKNGYAPDVEMFLRWNDLTREYLDELVKNGIVEVLPLYEGGVPTKVVLTDKGLRMAETPRRRR